MPHFRHIFLVIVTSSLSYIAYASLRVPITIESDV